MKFYLPRNPQDSSLHQGIFFFSKVLPMPGSNTWLLVMLIYSQGSLVDPPFRYSSISSNGKCIGFKYIVMGGHVKEWVINPVIKYGNSNHGVRGSTPTPSKLGKHIFFHGFQWRVWIFGCRYNKFYVVWLLWLIYHGIYILVGSLCCIAASGGLALPSSVGSNPVSLFNWCHVEWL